MRYFLPTTILTVHLGFQKEMSSSPVELSGIYCSNNKYLVGLMVLFGKYTFNPSCWLVATSNAALKYFERYGLCLGH